MLQHLVHPLEVAGIILCFRKNKQIHIQINMIPLIERKPLQRCIKVIIIVNHPHVLKINKSACSWIYSRYVWIDSVPAQKQRSCIRRNQVAAFAAMSGHGAERVAGLK